MALIKTFTQFRDQIKLEAKVNDTSEDTTIMDLTNECLLEICAQTKNLRDLRFDLIATVNGSGIVTPFAVYCREIEQVYFHKYNGASFVRRWELTEQSGVIQPSPDATYQVDAYTVSIDGSTVAAGPKLQLVLYPPGVAWTGNDRVQIIGTGFKWIDAVGDEMPYPSFYPFLKRSVIQRLMIKRGIDPQKVATFDKPIERSMNAAGTGSADIGGDTLRDE